MRPGLGGPRGGWGAQAGGPGPPSPAGLVRGELLREGMCRFSGSAPLPQLVSIWRGGERGGPRTAPSTRGAPRCPTAPPALQGEGALAAFERGITQCGGRGGGTHGCCWGGNGVEGKGEGPMGHASHHAHGSQLCLGGGAQAMCCPPTMVGPNWGPPATQQCRVAMATGGGVSAPPAASRSGERKQDGGDKWDAGWGGPHTSVPWRGTPKCCCHCSPCCHVQARPPQ